MKFNLATRLGSSTPFAVLAVLICGFLRYKEWCGEYAERVLKQHSTAGLEGQLDRYSSVARSNATRATLRQRMGNWPAYAAATGSALAMATSASATTISYAGPSLTASASSVFSASQHVKLGTAPTFFLTARHLANSFGLAVAGRSMSLLRETSGTVKKLGFNQVVSAGAGSFAIGKSVLDFRLASGSHSGEWAAGVPGFEGFKFRTTQGNGTQTNYGWAELVVNVDGKGLPDSVTLLGLAYGNAGEPISTPSSGVPEPGSAGLMLLALGAAGVAVLRKRRLQAVQS